MQVNPGQRAMYLTGLRELYSAKGHLDVGNITHRPQIINLKISLLWSW